MSFQVCATNSAITHAKKAVLLVKCNRASQRKHAASPPPPDLTSSERYARVSLNNEIVPAHSSQRARGIKRIVNPSLTPSDHNHIPAVRECHAATFAYFAQIARQHCAHRARIGALLLLSLSVRSARFDFAACGWRSYTFRCSTSAYIVSVT